VGCYIWYSEDGPGRAEAPPSPLIVVPNVTAHISASVPINVLLYDGPLMCGFNVAIKGLTMYVLNNNSLLVDKYDCRFQLAAVGWLSRAGNVICFHH